MATISIFQPIHVSQNSSDIQVSVLPDFSINPLSTVISAITISTPTGVAVIDSPGYWPAGVTLEVVEPGRTSRYTVEASTRFEPDQFILFNNMENSNAEDLASRGIVELSESKAMGSQSDIAMELFNGLTDILTQRITYNIYGSSNLGRSIRSLRYQQQLLYCFGLDFIPRFVMPFSSVDRAWFFTTEIAGIRGEKFVIDELPRISKEYGAVLSELGTSGVDTSSIDTITQVLNPKSSKINLLKYCAASLMGLAYLK